MVHHANLVRKVARFGQLRAGAALSFGGAAIGVARKLVLSRRALLARKRRACSPSQVALSGNCTLGGVRQRVPVHVCCQTHTHTTVNKPLDEMLCGAVVAPVCCGCDVVVVVVVVVVCVVVGVA